MHSRWLGCVLCVAYGLFGAGSPSYGQVEERYVDCSNGSDALTGLNPLNAWETLQKASEWQPSAGVHAIVYVKHDANESCGVRNLSLTKSGPGECHLNDPNDPVDCFLWKGEGPEFCEEDVSDCSNPVRLRNTTTSAAEDGIRIQGNDVMMENFTFFKAAGVADYDVALEIEGNGVLLRDVSVEDGVDEAGIRVSQAKDVLIIGGSVSSVDEGSGYYFVGTNTKKVDNVVVTNTSATNNHSSGYEVANYVDDISFINITASDNHPNPTPTPGVTGGAGIESSGSAGDPNIIVVDASITNNGRGIISRQGSLRVENAYIAGNNASGIQLTLGDAEAPSEIAIISSTIVDNWDADSVTGDAAQVESARKLGSLTIANSIIASTVATTSDRGRALRYERRNDAAFSVHWAHSLFYREESSLPIITWQDRDNNEHDCSISGGIGNCDAVGDNNLNMSVDNTELAAGAAISLTTSGVSSSEQQYDENGDGQVTVEERIAAALIASGDAAHVNMLTGEPWFSGKRLLSGSPGEDDGDQPQEIDDLWSRGIAACRAEGCDQEGKTRVSQGSGYDMGALEDDGEQAACNLLPGECLLPGSVASTVTIDVRDREICTTAGVLSVPFDLASPDGAVISGAQADITYDPAKLTFTQCGSGLASSTDFTVDYASLSSNKIRVVFGDFATGNLARDKVGTYSAAFQCNFQVVGTFSGTTITASNVVVSGESGDRLPVTWSHGNYTPKSCSGGGC